MTSWQSVLMEPGRLMFIQAEQFVVSILLVLIILGIGLLISQMVRKIVTRILKTARLDELSDRIELDALLHKGGISVTISELIGTIIYWLGILITFVVAFNAVGLTAAAQIIDKLVGYIPRIISAIFVIIVGMFVASLLKNIVKTAAANTGLSQANFLSRLVEVVVMIFAVAVALEQVNIGAQLIHIILGIILGAIGLGMALAFGLGCKDIAAKSMQEFIDKFKSGK